MRFLILLTSLLWALGAHCADLELTSIPGDGNLQAISEALLSGEKFTVRLDNKIPVSRGDLHFLTGNLHNSWSREDFQDFYSVSKWLSEQGIRTIINPAAKKEDLIAALGHPDTVGIIWNSHGGLNGEVYDTNNEPIGKSAFKKKGKNLKYFLFANCYGLTSKKFYQLDKNSEIFTMGWKGQTTSPLVYKYLYSQKFHQEFQTALEK